MQRLDAASVGLALSLVFVPAEAYSPRSAYFGAGATGATQSQKDFNALKGKARADDKDDRDDHDGTCGDRPLGNRDHGGHQNCDDDELFSISGAINPSEGSAGATVNLGGTASATTTADQKGRYRFEALASGAYVVTPSRDGYAFTPASRFVGITTKAIKEIDFWASPTHALTGTITPAVAGAGGTITLSDGSTTSADDLGLYKFTDLADGTYTVTPSNAGFTFTPASQTVTLSGKDVTGVDFTGVSVGENVLFFDDFTGTTVDPTWTAMNREGDLSNGEIGCYQSANVGVADGMLQITSQVETKNCGGVTYGYTSGMVQWTSFNFTYGTVEFRAKMAAGQGTWPAIWLLGADCQAGNIRSANPGAPCVWPQVGSDEIDITEIKSGALNTVWQNVVSGGSGFQTCTPTTTDVSLNWHTYNLEWAPQSLIWKIDGTETCRFTNNIPSTPMFMMINTAIGGNGGGTIDNSTLPQKMFVDYVKVTQK